MLYPGHKRPKVEHIASRVSMVLGKTADNVIGKLLVPNARGGSVLYKNADLRYDLKCGYLSPNDIGAAASSPSLPRQQPATISPTVRISRRPTKVSSHGAVPIKHETSKMAGVKKEKDTKTGKTEISRRPTPSTSPSNKDSTVTGADIDTFGPQMVDAVTPIERITQAIKRAHEVSNECHLIQDYLFAMPNFASR